MCRALPAESMGQDTVRGPLQDAPPRFSRGLSSCGFGFEVLTSKTTTGPLLYVCSACFSLFLFKTVLGAACTKPQWATRGLWKVVPKSARVTCAAFRRTGFYGVDFCCGAFVLFFAWHNNAPDWVASTTDIYFSQCRRSSVQDQGVRRLGFFGGPLLGLLMAISSTVSSHGLFSARLHAPGVQIPSVWGRQPEIS